MYFPLITTALIALSSGAQAAPTFLRRADVCNGRAELCGRGYGTVSYLTAHDSFGVSANPLALGRNQQVDLRSQLDLGARALQGQAHMKDGVLNFCHTSCALFDGGSVADYLKTVKTFLDENKNEVLTLIFTNPEGVSVKDVWAPIFQDAGIADLAFVPPSLPVKAADWPTLGSMIDSGKRVVVFMDSKADPAAVPFILPQFDNVWEPPFSEVDPTFPCRVDRKTGDLKPEEMMWMMNHNLNTPVIQVKSRNFIDDLIQKGKDLVDDAAGKIDDVKDAVNGILIPDFLKAGETNSVASITANNVGCASFSGNRAANFVLLDFIDVGEGKKAVDTLNGF